MFNSRLGCSSISFRHQDLSTALRTISGLGFEEIDLGALPGVCDHVPYDLDAEAVAAVTAEVAASGLRVRSVNGDIGDLNAVLDAGGQAARERHLEALLTLTANTGAKALVLPCGALGHDPVRSIDEDLDTIAAQLIHAGQRAAEFGVELWTESLHFLRFCWNLERAELLARRLAGSGVGIVMDFSHIVAAGEDPLEYLERHAGPDRPRPPARCGARQHQPQHRQRQGGFRRRAALAGSPGLHRPLLARTRNPGHHPRRTPRGRRQGSQLHHRPHLTTST